MQRFDSQEILDSEACPPGEVETSLRDLCRINRWFGGVSTTRKLIERAAVATGKKHLSLLEVAAGFGEVPRAAGEQLAEKRDLARNHRSRPRRDTPAARAIARSLPMRWHFPFATPASIW